MYSYAMKGGILFPKQFGSNCVKSAKGNLMREEDFSTSMIYSNGATTIFLVFFLPPLRVKQPPSDRAFILI